MAQFPKLSLGSVSVEKCIISEKKQGCRRWPESKETQQSIPRQAGVTNREIQRPGGTPHYFVFFQAFCTLPLNSAKHSTSFLLLRKALLKYCCFKALFVTRSPGCGLRVPFQCHSNPSDL